MKWELEALKILARNPSVPGIALQDTVEEIERLTKRERRDCAAIIELRKNLKDANKKLDSADSLLEEISIWFYKNIGNSEPLWKDKFVSVCQMFEPEMTHKDRKK